METAAPTIRCSNCGSNNFEFYANATDVEYFNSESVYTYNHCNNCDVLFIHPLPLEELHKIYPANYYSFTGKTGGLSFSFKNKLDRIFFRNQLKRLPQQKINVLDVGGGNGMQCDSIKKADSRVAVTQIVDIDPAAAAQAREKGHKYFCGSIEDFETEQLYDVVLLLNIIEHVESPASLLQKISRLLSPGGIIIIKTPNYRSLDADLFRHKNWGGYHCPRHWIIFNKKSLFNLSKDCNLQPVYFTYTQGAPFWTVSILHRLHQWKWIHADAQNPLIYHPLFGVISIMAATFDFIRKPFAPLSQVFVVLKHPVNNRS